ncbi:MAG: RagB/SusD family nutrient uptake outer membrane protein [Candidatus Ordinivivax streblomastigis]|uniref:RagB/SusD family nutrient uptake outer membrane protein n=1 Tax=Candidatus Ordinivivax streblomastigis TaxID=2540710 RepID=A0A5M8NUV6_9BACT|nr:MAG: RagB/SusD family nutrient uptake outer membrane protein [Candidatus Ordinivivax streblomastigis]
MKKIAVILINIMLLASCSDILDKVPLDIISDEAVWNDEALTDAYLTNIYTRMHFFGNESYGTGWWDSDMAFACFAVNVVSDECMTNWSDWGDAVTWYNYKFGNLRIGGGLMEWWGYGQIRDLNTYIERLPGTTLENNLKTAKLAEARFLRAFAYFAMVKRYGGVPIITKVQSINEPENELYPDRNKEVDVYDFVIRELDEIVNDLPDPSATETGRPGKSAALALKSRAALYAGSIAQYGKVQLDNAVGIPAEKANSYYQMAYDTADRIIKSGWHQLYNQDVDKITNFKNIFLNENNSEVIFSKPHNSLNSLDENGSGWCVDFFCGPRPNGWSRGNLLAPYLEMAEDFEYIDGRPGTLDRVAIQQGLWSIDELWKDKDPRFFATLYTQNTPWQGDKCEFYNGLLKPDGTIQTSDSYNDVLAMGDQDMTSTCFGVMKYLDESHDNMAGTNSAWATSATDWQIFRYAEILLNYAEAAFELGKTGDALSAVNQIRNRAGIAPLASIDRDKIRHERKVELAFEGHRYWDVRRWRTAVTDLSRDFSGLRYILDYNSYMAGTPKYKLMILDKIDGSVTSPLFREENYYLPITQERTSNNPKLVENPGYQ